MNTSRVRRHVEHDDRQRDAQARPESAGSQGNRPSRPCRPRWAGTDRRRDRKLRLPRKGSPSPFPSRIAVTSGRRFGRICVSIILMSLRTHCQEASTNSALQVPWRRRDDEGISAQPAMAMARMTVVSHARAPSRWRSRGQLKREEDIHGTHQRSQASPVIPPARPMRADEQGREARRESRSSAKSGAMDQPRPDALAELVQPSR